MNNLSYLLTRTAAHHPNRPATFHGDSIQDYRWLDGQVGRLASGLAGLAGAGGASVRNARVGLILDNEPRGLVSLLGPLRAGMVIVPTNPRLHPAEQAFILANCGARVTMASRQHLDGLLAAEGMPAGMTFI